MLRNAYYFLNARSSDTEISVPAHDMHTWRLLFSSGKHSTCPLFGSNDSVEQWSKR
jgi:hypothetical protein